MKRSKKAIAILMAAVCLCLAACGAAGGASEWNTVESPKAPQTSNAAMDMWYTDEANYAPAPSPSAAPGAAAAPDSSLSMGSGNSDSTVYQNSGVKLIRRASMTIQTTEFEQSAAALEQLVSSLGGYYQEAQVRTGGYYDSSANRSGEYTIRIPAERYNDFMNQAGTVGHVTSRYESSQDVGESYYDLEARLKTQRTKQERLLSLLERAETMEDIIMLESALSEVEYQIEQYSSSLNRYDGLIGYATINLSLNEVTKIVDEPGEKDSLGRRLLAGFASSGERLVEGFQNFLLWIAYNIFGIIIFAVILIVVTVVLRRRKPVLFVRKKLPNDEEGEQK